MSGFTEPDALLVCGVNKITGHFQPNQWNPRCRDIELSAAECVSAYGFFRGKEKCKELLEDVFECMYNVKQNLRLEAMMKEHNRQVKEGKRGYIPMPHINYFKV